LNPNSLEAERTLADNAMLKGDMNALEDAANQMIRLEPQSPQGYALRALSNINRGQFDAAERDARRAIDVAPQDAFGYVQLGNLKLAQKQYSDAAKAYQDALDRNAGSTDALRGLINTFIAEKQVENAIAAAKAQIGKSPNSSSFYELLGATLFRFTKDLNGAEAALLKSVALDSKNQGAVIQLCQVQAANGEFDQAIGAAEQSLRQNPQQPNLDIVMGSLYESRTDWNRAENAYQAALSVDPQNPVASNDLARVMLDNGGSIETALALAQTARQGSPESPAVFDTLGWIYYHQGMYALAVNSLQQALSLEEKHQMPDNPDIHYHLGMAYEKAKQPALAREHFEHVLKTDPNYRGAAEIKAELTRLKS
jgi:tetratricopeptide (TPR) repeat protein